MEFLDNLKIKQANLNEETNIDTEQKQNTSSIFRVIRIPWKFSTF